MAQIEYQILTDADLALFSKSLQSGDRFTYSKIIKKTALLSRTKKVGLTARSMLPEIASAWNLLTDVEQTAWKTAGLVCGLNGYRLFVKDKSLRIINSMDFNSVPTILHQAKVGNIKIQSPATQIKIVQLHPSSYWISQPVKGKKGMREPVAVTENFDLPLTISLNYSSNLSACGPNPYAKFYAQVWRSYQGVDIQQNLEINLDFVSDWKNASAVLSEIIGQLIAYDLYFEINDLQGDLYFDIIKAEHSGQNWVRDSNCDDINQSFTLAFYQIPKNWAALILPNGSEFGSIFQDF